MQVVSFDNFDPATRETLLGRDEKPRGFLSVLKDYARSIFSRQNRAPENLMLALQIEAVDRVFRDEKIVPLKMDVQSYGGVLHFVGVGRKNELIDLSIRLKDYRVIHTRGAATRHLQGTTLATTGDALTGMVVGYLPRPSTILSIRWPTPASA